MADTDIAEIWLPIPSFPGYEASSLGRVRSVDRITICRETPLTKSHPRKYPGKIFKASVDGAGYRRVTLHGCVYRQVHVLVCEAFHGGKPSPEHEVAHWDGDQTNNRPANLRWATAIENNADKRRHGTLMCGEAVPSAKLSEFDIYEIRHRAASGDTQQRIADDYAVQQSTISAIISRKAWKHVP